MPSSHISKPIIPISSAVAAGPLTVVPHALSRLALGLLRAYKLLISPLFFAGACRFHPSCSDYTAEAIIVHGVARGTFMGMRRLLRCHPFGGSGYDPVVVPTPKSST